MRRKLMLGVVVFALPAATIALVSSPATAKTAKPAPFTGAATGSVACSFPKLKISFVPPLTNAYTGVSTITVKGSLLDCVTSGSNVNIKKGKITGTFHSTGGCGGLVSGTTSPVTLTIQWKGKTKANGKATLTNSSVSVKGAYPAFKGQDVGFELPNPTAAPPRGTVAGSFAGSVNNESFAYTSSTVNQLSADCAPTSKTTKHGTKTKPAKGIKKLKVTSGKITLP